jgi:hypothetical protein
MLPKLDQILSSLVEESLKVTLGDRAALEAALASGNTLVEGFSCFAEQVVQDGAELFHTLGDEIFLDLHTSITLAFGNRIKGAAVLLRSALEASVFERACCVSHQPNRCTDRE